MRSCQKPCSHPSAKVRPHCWGAFVWKKTCFKFHQEAWVDKQMALPTTKSPQLFALWGRRQLQISDLPWHVVKRMRYDSFQLVLATSMVDLINPRIACLFMPGSHNAAGGAKPTLQSMSISWQRHVRQINLFSNTCFSWCKFKKGRVIWQIQAAVWWGFVTRCCRKNK